MRRLWAVLLLVSCERAHEEPDVKPMPAPHVTIRMIDAGREPRVALRAHPQPGMSMTYYFRRTLEMKGLSKRVVELIYNARVVDVDRNQFHTRMTMLSSLSTPASKTDFDHSVLGTTSDVWRDTRGIYTRDLLMRTRYEGKSAHRPEMQLAFPEEPVGPGAKWHEEVDFDGAHASVDVELESDDGDHVRERLVYLSSDSGQKLPTALNGTATLDLSRKSLDGRAHIENTMTLRVKGRDVPVTEAIDITPVVGTR
jgi:hypothetical protein